MLKMSSDCIDVISVPPPLHFTSMRSSFGKCHDILNYACQNVKFRCELLLPDNKRLMPKVSRLSSITGILLFLSGFIRRKTLLDPTLGQAFVCFVITDDLIFCVLSISRSRPRQSDGPGVSVPRRGAEHKPHEGGPDAPAEHGQGVQHRGAAGRR